LVRLSEKLIALHNKIVDAEFRALEIEHELDNYKRHHYASSSSSSSSDSKPVLAPKVENLENLNCSEKLEFPPPKLSNCEFEELQDDFFNNLNFIDNTSKRGQLSNESSYAKFHHAPTLRRDVEPPKQHTNDYKQIFINNLMRRTVSEMIIPTSTYENESRMVTTMDRKHMSNNNDTDSDTGISSLHSSDVDFLPNQNRNETLV
jgi:hypothetical protein